LRLRPPKGGRPRARAQKHPSQLSNRDAERGAGFFGTVGSNSFPGGEVLARDGVMP